MIVASAIRDSEGVVHVGYRHSHVLCSPGYDRYRFRSGEQGFITEQHRFLTRDAAFVYAKQCGQLPRSVYRLMRKRWSGGKFRRHTPRLMSEDVWPHDLPEWGTRPPLWILWKTKS